MRIAVLGPGGVGGLIAGLLARSGAEVVVIAREPTAEVIAERGLKVQSVMFGEVDVRVRARARLREEVEQWWAIKRSVSEAILAEGGTITHHHAVGRDHRPWYDEQRPAPFAAALRGAKAAVDPQGIMNPGVLIDPQPAPRP